ncbi:MAG: AAA family ATPase [Planctomycetia bacterium]|nr:AAA family ATPase [Planctomycetia bacterium]
MTQERRTVVVLFAHAGGLADIPEAGRAPATDAVFGRMRDAVEKHGGVVDKAFGETLMAVFGAPVAHVDDAARAVRAALEIVLDGPAKERGAALALRAGLNRGEVLWGAVAGTQATAMGDAVNVAHRLMELAAPGTILASKAVADACPDRAFTARGPMALRGREGTVEALEAHDRLRDRTEMRLSPAMGTFVGREKELEELAGAIAKGGEAILLRGGAGSGKSRLLAEARRLLRSRAPAVRAVVGRSRDGAPLPLLAFREILSLELRVSPAAGPGPLVQALERDLGPTRAHLVALSAGAAPEDSPVRGLAPAAAAAEAAAAWADWLRARAAGESLLVCLEDLQWADRATLDLAGNLAASLRGSRVAIVASMRPGPAAPAGFRELAVGELGSAPSRALLEAALGGRATDDLARWSEERSGGNPYFIEALAAHFRAAGAVTGPPFALRPGAPPIPDSLHGLLVASIDALPQEERAALKTASVFGRTFWSGLASALAGHDLAPAFAASCDRGVLFRQERSMLPGDEELAFRHALLRDAAYSLLTKRDRARLHGAAADRLAAIGRSGARGVLSLAAGHSEAAGRPSEAAGLWMAALSEARREHVHAELLDCARNALRLGARGEAAKSLAGALLGLGRYAEALEFCRKLQDDPSQPPDLRSHARATAGRCLVPMGRVAEAMARYDAALAGTDDPAERLEALRLKAELLFRLKRVDEAEAALRLARAEVARKQSGNARRDAALLGTMEGILLDERGDYVAGLTAFDEALAMWRGLGEAAGLVWTIGNRGNCLDALGRKDEALAAQVEALSIFEKMGDRRGMAVALNNIGKTRNERNDLPGARAAWERAFELNVALGFVSAIVEVGLLVAAARRADGDHAGAAAAARIVLDAAPRMSGGEAREKAIESARPFLAPTGFQDPAGSKPVRGS